MYLGSVLYPLCQVLQKRLRILQIRRIKPLGEPVVHRREQVGGVLALVLGLPQAGQAGGSAEFEGFGLLVASNIEGLVEAGQLKGRSRASLP